MNGILVEKPRKNVLTKEDIAYMMDLADLKFDTSLSSVTHMVEIGKKYGCGTCFCWPCYYPQLVELLKDAPITKFGSSLGYPSGQEATETKIFLAEQFKKLEPATNDMQVNVGWLKDGYDDLVYQDIKAVRDATPGVPLKVICEVMQLTDDEIRRVCEISYKAGADYIKTGSGWSDKPTTLHHIKVIMDTVGDKMKVKMSGGVRSLDTLLKAYKMGVTRFGIGCASAEKVLAEAEARGGVFNIDDVVIDPSEL